MQDPSALLALDDFDVLDVDVRGGKGLEANRAVFGSIKELTASRAERIAFLP